MRRPRIEGLDYDVVIIDDPTKPQEEWDQEAALKWFKENFPSRMRSEGPTICVMSKLYKDNPG